MPNHLVHETSPYLLQHVDNPVDWYPWGPEALIKASTENKPIFLSIGYAACHWCHVMAHESFEDPQIAALLNQNFISIKVDREERLDLDGIYMAAVVAMTGQGGWPMSLFLTPEGQPFYGGTYFPPVRRFGMPSFSEVLNAAALAWQNDPAALRGTASNLTNHLLLQSAAGVEESVMPLRSGLLNQATQSLLASYDWQAGGWGHAPRFPQPMSIEFLLLQTNRGEKRALDAVVHNLQILSRGGIYDVVGGGFHRYSTDDEWLVPHFEKMLYDNAQLASAYLHAWKMTGNPLFRHISEETLDFLLREMSDPLGGFYSSLDADSEGKEGKFYLWSDEEICTILEPIGELDLFLKVYSVSPTGNFDGHNILQSRTDLMALADLLQMEFTELSLHLTRAHHALYTARSARIHPSTDDKVLTSWNALALRTLAEAARWLNRPDYLAAAQKNADFLLTALHPQKKLLRAWRAGQARHNAYLEDYSALILGLLALYQTDFDLHWYTAAENLAEEMIAAFSDPAGGFFDTRSDQEQLITRPKDIQDNATPCGNSLAALALLQLAAFNGREDWRKPADSLLPVLQDNLVRHPSAFGVWLQALDFYTGPVRQIALVYQSPLNGILPFIKAVQQRFLPRTVTAVSMLPLPQGTPFLLHNRPLVDESATAYLCEGFTCQLPQTDPIHFSEMLESHLPR